MTHYTVNYAGLPNREKRQRALWDCRDFMGLRQYNKVRSDMRKHFRDNPTRRTATMLRQITGMMSLAGIQGYPARAFVLHCYQTRNQVR